MRYEIDAYLIARVKQNKHVQDFCTRTDRNARGIRMAFFIFSRNKAVILHQTAVLHLHTYTAKREREREGYAEWI